MNLFLKFCSLFYIVTIEVLYLLLQEKGYYNASATSFGLHAGLIDVPHFNSCLGLSVCLDINTLYMFLQPFLSFRIIFKYLGIVGL